MVDTTNWPVSQAFSFKATFPKGAIGSQIREYTFERVRISAEKCVNHVSGLYKLSAAVRVFLCTRPTDLRKGFDGLSGLVQECFNQDLLTGHLFLFLNRRRDRMKILYFDRDGLVLWYKRLEVGCFRILEPIPGAAPLSGSAGVELSVTDLALILHGIDLATARRRKRYSRVG